MCVKPNVSSTQYACTILSFVASQLYNIFPHYLTNGMISEKVIKHNVCVLILSTTLPETFLILRRNERDMIKQVY